MDGYTPLPNQDDVRDYLDLLAPSELATFIRDYLVDRAQTTHDIEHLGHKMESFHVASMTLTVSRD